jgi:hypothetical protein
MTLLISEPCRIWIEESIDEGLAGGKTPDLIGKEVSQQVAYQFEVEVKAATIKKKAQRQKAKQEGTDVPTRKPKRKHTKPEVRTALNEAAQAIQADEVALEDVKTVVDSVAKGIADGDLPYKLGEPIKRASDKHRPRRKKGAGKQTTLHKIFLDLNRAVNDLRGYLDSGIKPEGTDKDFFQGIRHQAPLLISCFHDMGIDIEKVMATVTGTPKEITHVKTAKNSKQSQAG